MAPFTQWLGHCTVSPAACIRPKQNLSLKFAECFDNLQSGSHLCTKSLHVVVCRVKLYECCRSFDPRMGTTGRVLWEAVPELLHLGAVIMTAAVMVGVMGNTLFGYRAEAMSTLSCMPLHTFLPWQAHVCGPFSLPCMCPLMKHITCCQ